MTRYVMDMVYPTIFNIPQVDVATEHVQLILCFIKMCIIAHKELQTDYFCVRLMYFL
jgi:hypothetical protein